MTTTIAPADLARLQARMRTFLDDRVLPIETELESLGPQWHRSERLAALREDAKAEGLWALGHPAAMGGGGVPFMDFVHLNEVIGRSEWGQRVFGTATMQDAIMLDACATDEIRQRWLPPLVAGDIHPSVGLTEPEVAGSDPTLMQAHAHLEDDGRTWVINAHKWFTTHANRAAFTTIFCRTDPNAARHQQFSAILVPTDTPGYEMVRVLKTMGSTIGGHCEIRLTDVRVPVNHLIGERGKGFAVSQLRLGPGRIFHCMRWLGQAERAFDIMCDRANSRFAHGSVLAAKGEIRRMVAESTAEIQSSRLLVLDAARKMDAGQDARVEIALAKFWGARMLHNVVDRAIQVCGGLGVTDDLPLERMYREARFARILDGPDEVHRMTVAKSILAKPEKAPWTLREPVPSST